MTERIDRASLVIRASPSTIYRAFASPAAIEAWLPPEGMTGRVLAFDFREGGSYRMRLEYLGPDHVPGKTSENADEVEVRFRRLVEGERIEQVVTFDSGSPEFSGEMTMTWLFRPVPGGTEVTVSAANVPAGIRPEDHAAGLTASLRNLASFTE